VDERFVEWLLLAAAPVFLTPPAQAAESLSAGRSADLPTIELSAAWQYR
jgi:hypothetical protein